VEAKAVEATTRLPGWMEAKAVEAEAAVVTNALAGRPEPDLELGSACIA
tara:strand:+ start:350 stop:496 length:147 start_codon:yes stop_codon:yes gene_type:complete